MDEMSEGKQSFDVKSCSVHSVVVYKDRAEVRRNLSLRLEAGGETEVLLTGLSSSIDIDSIRVEGSGNATILDVIYETKSEEPADNDGKKEEIDGLSEEIKEKKKELATIEFQLVLIDRQKNILTEFSGHVTSGGQDKKKEEGADGIFHSTVQPEAVNGVMEFMARYEEKMSSLDERYLDLSTQKKRLGEELKVLTTKLDNLSSSYRGKEIIRSVKVILYSNEKVDVTLVVSYVVKDASWSPIYDIRVFTKDKTLKTHYYGLIKQSTGEDWDNASISLSTAQPDIGGSPPSLGVHHIGFERARYVTRSYGKKKASLNFISSASYRGGDSGSDDEWFEDDSDLMMNAGFTGLESCAIPDKRLGSSSPVTKRRAAKPPSLEVDVSKVDTGQLYNALFSIPRTSTIPSDNTEHKVTVGILDMAPDFSYVAVPRLSPSSFLQAAVKNTSPYALLAGPANVFLDNNFLTKSNLPSTSPNEEFTISLGVDESIRITCQPMNIVRGTAGRITKNNHLLYTFVYTVKNTQANVVELKVMEQVPLSSDEKLKVLVQQPDLKKQKVKVPFSHGFSLLNEDNNIEWHCTLPPDTSTDLQLVYTLDFPPNDLVTGLPNC